MPTITSQDVLCLNIPVTQGAVGLKEAAERQERTRALVLRSGDAPALQCWAARLSTGDQARAGTDPSLCQRLLAHSCRDAGADRQWLKGLSVALTTRVERASPLPVLLDVRANDLQRRCLILVWFCLFVVCLFVWFSHNMRYFPPRKCDSCWIGKCGNNLVTHF